MVFSRDVPILINHKRVLEFKMIRVGALTDIDMGASHVRNILFESFLGLVGDRLAVEL